MAQPDSGMWELTETRQYTTSKLGCWQALTHAVHLAQIGQIPGSVDRWRVSALALVGRVDEARELMNDVVGSLNDVGVLSEMIDPHSGAFGGNLP